MENEKEVVGYEFKFLESKDISKNYPKIYSGFGQALMYSFHGIEKSILCIGISGRIGERTMEKNIQLTSAVEYVIRLMEPCSRFLGLWVYHEEGGTQRMVNYPPRGRFPVDEYALIRKDKENILAGNMSWDKHILERYHLA